MSDIWFAWYPVQTGALGGGAWHWLEPVWRNRCMGATIYQPIDMVRNSEDFPRMWSEYRTGRRRG